MNPIQCSVATVLMLAVLLWSPAASAVPGQMTYTGYLTKGGKPFSTGAAPLKVFVKIFSSSTGGIVPLWEEAISKVDVKDGVFSLVLGKTKALNATILDGSARYVEIVLGAQTMSPRLPLLTAPYAFTASNCTGHLTPKSVKVGAGGTISVGTNTPSSDLDIRKTMSGKAVSLRAWNQSNTGFASLSLSAPKGSTPHASFMIARYGDGYLGKSAAGSPLGGNIQLYNAANNGDLIINTHGDYRFESGKSELVRITSSGKVGIGTTTPNALLNVNGDTRIQGVLYAGGDVISSGSSHTTMSIQGGGTYQGGQIDLAGGYGTVDGSIKFRAGYGTAGAEPVRMTISKTGHVGIGTPSPQHMLHVAGSIGGNGQYHASDGRYKQRIKIIRGALASVTRLHGRTFTWRRAAYMNKNFSAGRQLGVIAQEVEAVVPEVVHTDRQGYKSVDYTKLTPLLIEAIKEQQKEIAHLRRELKSYSSLRREIREIKGVVARLARGR